MRGAPVVSQSVERSWPPGVRISLRRRLPEGGYGDVIGVVLAWDRDVARLERRDGTVVEVDPATVVAAKQVPPPPERRR